MDKITNIKKEREKKRQVAGTAGQHEGFQPCSQDMTICGDCEGNRAKKKCPRLREWLAKRLG
jgi:hypothetical protein